MTGLTNLRIGRGCSVDKLIPIEFLNVPNWCVTIGRLKETTEPVHELECGVAVKSIYYCIIIYSPCSMS